MFVLCTAILSANLIVVIQDGSGDATSIQEGINLAAPADTVLVGPGIWIGGIEIVGKSITLASYYLVDANPEHIQSTIIDGDKIRVGIKIDQSGSVDAPVQVIGFTIRNCRGDWYPNNPYETAGGGIGLYQSHAVVAHCEIFDNQSVYGGGIAALYSSLHLKANDIHHNNALLAGGGVCGVYNGTYISFDSVALNSIYLNNSITGMDICYAVNCLPTTVYLEKGSVSNSDLFFYYCSGYMPVFVLQADIAQVDHDLWVSPEGDNSNDGASPQSPLKTISYALAKLQPLSDEVRDIHIMPGRYSYSSNKEMLPLQPKSRVNLIGADMRTVILDGENYSPLIIGKRAPDYLSIQNLTLENGYAITDHLLQLDDIRYANANELRVENIHIRNSWSLSDGVRIMGYKDVRVSNLIIEDSQVGNGVIVSCMQRADLSNFRIQRLRPTNYNIVSTHNTPVIIYRFASHSNYDTVINISNFLITDNIDTNTSFGGSPITSGLAVVVEGGNGEVNLTNCTIANNSSTTNSAGFAIGLENTIVNISNTIVAGNQPYEFNLVTSGEDPNSTAHANIRNSLIQGGDSSIIAPSPQATYTWVEGNIFENPKFAMNERVPYKLASNSPCIDAGTMDTDSLNLPPFDLAQNSRIWNNRIDMGCYEYGSEAYVDIADDYFPLPPEAIAVSVYPNPFNPQTTISYELPVSGLVRVGIYNVKGQKVKTLYHGWQAQGTQSLIWNGLDEGGSLVGSGVYFAHLEQNGRSTTVKLMLLK